MDARDYEDAYQRDDKPREVKSNRAWRLECESLRQQLAEYKARENSAEPRLDIYEQLAECERERDKAEAFKKAAYDVSVRHAEQPHHDIILAEANVQLLNDHIDSLKDEVEYHKADAKKWALQALKFDKWQPIESAPKDGRYLIVGNEDGVWVACYTPTFQSGFQPDNPWISLMLNHRHIEKVKRNYSSVPTHWMPLPAPPKLGYDKTGAGS